MVTVEWEGEGVITTEVTEVESGTEEAEDGANELDVAGSDGLSTNYGGGYGGLVVVSG